MQTHEKVSSGKELTPALLRELANEEGTCITVALQTGGNMRGRFADTMRELERKLTAYDSTLPDEVLEPLRRTLPQMAQEPENGKIAGGIVILSSPGVQYRFTTGHAVEEMIEVGDAFHLRSLLPILKQKTEFYLLALSQKHTRLLHCTESDSHEVAFPSETPTTYDASRQTKQPDHDLETRSSAGPSVGSMKGVLSGSSSDADNKDEYLHNYFRAIDRGVHAVLRDSGLPLVVVAVQHELALYRALNTYSNLVEPGVHGAPDGLKGGEMHRRAIELLASQPPQSVQKVLDGFEKHVGTGHASTHAQEIVKAAHEGRISHLFLQESAEYRGVFDETRQKVKRHENPEVTHDLLNDAMIQTLRHGGDVTQLTAKEMPGGVPYCAIFRYPAPAFHEAPPESAVAGAV